MDAYLFVEGFSPLYNVEEDPEGICPQEMRYVAMLHFASNRINGNQVNLLARLTKSTYRNVAHLWWTGTFIRVNLWRTLSRSS